MQGTIPYLGTFLTDLVMMDTAMKDYTEVSCFTSVVKVCFPPTPCQGLGFLIRLLLFSQGGLINFEKRRKVMEMSFV